MLPHSPLCLPLPDFLPQCVNHDQFPLLIGIVPVLPAIAGRQITHHRQNNRRFTGLSVEIEPLPWL